ncbi:hypothetical protein [Crossiella sp. CA198]|uniref:hypothetical protein n=1 Tax=Crossiella sp. CA198 TaxID=3455607 RepID=UPI003F8D8501
MIGRTGRVTGRIGPGLIGEVMLEIRGGSEAYYAKPAERAATIEVDTRVLVVDFEPPRMLYVEPWELPAF